VTLTPTSPSRRSAIVTGANGQDGSFLVGRLLAEGTAVHATVRDRSKAGDLQVLPGADGLTVHELDVTDRHAIGGLVAAVGPTELYNVAGRSSVSASFADPVRTWDVNATAVAALLEAVRSSSPSTVVYHSSSIDMFGGDPGAESIHDEGSALRPTSPYAAAKAAAHLLCDGYRRAFGLRVACGILSIHESRRRPASFLTRKVVDHVRDVHDRRAAGLPVGEPLAVGNLAVRRDWGFAPDFVDGMIRIARQVAVRAEIAGRDAEEDVASSYRDYLLATGELHAVWEVVDRAFALAGDPITWDRNASDPARWSARFAGTDEPAVVVDSSLFRRSEPAAIGGDPRRAREELGWTFRPGLDPFLADMLGLPAAAPVSS